MKLTPELKFIQEKLVLAAHPWLSTRECKNIEREIQWCIACEFWKIWDDRKMYFIKERTQWSEIWWNNRRWLNLNFFDYIIWLPPTLSRVLNGLGNWFIYYDKMLKERQIDDDMRFEQKCMRKLINEDWSDCTLFEQSEQTIKMIAEIMWYKSE